MASQPTYFTDGVFSFEGGLNAGINPLLLQRNQLAEANNCTVRGTFVTHRPGRRKIALTYAPGIQSAVQGGMFQGACFYNYDTGGSSLMAAISGRLFQFSLSDDGAAVDEKSIAGDLNPAGQTQAWLWQAENYLIWNDGISVPIFYDGLTSRRSVNDGSVLGTTLSDFVSPNVGSTVLVGLKTAYLGGYNDTVIIEPGGAVYTVVPTSGVYQVTLENVSDTAGMAVPAKTPVNTNTAILGVVSGNFNYGGPLAAGTNIQIELTLPITFPSGTAYVFSLGGTTWGTSATVPGNPSRIAASNQSASPGNVSVTDGQILTKNSGGTVTKVATVTSGFSAPARGSTTTVNVDLPYTGPAGAVVYIGSAQYKITAVAPPAAGTQIGLLNNTDTAGKTVSAPVTLNSLPELPPGRMGAYGMSRNWVCLLDGISFLAGDIVGGSSGTPAYSQRDAVLKVSENTFLNGGGVFRVPGTVGDIRAMRFATTLDASLGQGPLQVFTPTTVFSCNTPVDRTTWQNLTNPILTESLIANGAQGQNSTVAANGDTFMRSIDGLRSLILARRDFATWGNVPISHEVNPVLSQDDKALLQYGSAIVFDNRLLFTASPTSSSQGVYHPSAVALNFDPLSSLGKKSPPVYDGFWDGLNVLQYITGLYNGVQRAFAFALNTTTNTIELWEILATDAATDDGGARIAWDFSTGALFKDLEVKGPFDYCQLTDGEVFFDNVLGRVDFEASYKPDEYSSWVPWRSWSVTNTGTAPRSFPRMGLGEPSSSDFNPDTRKELRLGYTFQIRLAVVGHCRFLGARFKATPQPQPQFAKPVCGGDS